MVEKVSNSKRDINPLSALFRRADHIRSYPITDEDLSKMENKRVQIGYGHLAPIGLSAIHSPSQTISKGNRHCSVTAASLYEDQVIHSGRKIHANNVAGYRKTKETFV
jgi:hypothetical protein